MVLIFLVRKKIKNIFGKTIICVIMYLARGLAYNKKRGTFGSLK